MVTKKIHKSNIRKMHGGRYDGLYQVTTHKRSRMPNAYFKTKEEAKAYLKESDENLIELITNKNDPRILSAVPKFFYLEDGWPHHAVNRGNIRAGDRVAKKGSNFTLPTGENTTLNPKQIASILTVGEIADYREESNHHLEPILPLSHVKTQVLYNPKIGKLTCPKTGKPKVVLAKSKGRRPRWNIRLVGLNGENVVTGASRVAMLFIDGKWHDDEKPQVHHINNVVLDNRACNLRRETRLDNNRLRQVHLDAAQENENN